ncbi:AAA family ATPase [Pseudomonas xanthosomatis]|uniref:AAA family ATPase n=1 Tax=Pseudomonas xanthosomatis TaxID=2842356 RepID=UPI003516250E
MNGLATEQDEAAAMYHDDREIEAEQQVEALEAKIKEFIANPTHDCLLSMVLLAAHVVIPSADQDGLLDRLRSNDEVLCDFSESEFQDLLAHARSAIGFGRSANYLLTHLAAKAIADYLGIDYRHPKLVAALVGTIQSTLSTPLFECLPNTAELSLGLLGKGPRASFPMSRHIAERHSDLITLRLLASDTQAIFQANRQPRSPDTTYLLDAPYADLSPLFKEVNRLLDSGVQSRLVLVLNWAATDSKAVWKELRRQLKDRAHIEAFIDFSSLPDPANPCTAIIISAVPYPPDQATLYIDVSMANKSLPPLDGIERMLLAGCIYNLWQGRPAHRSSEYLSTEVWRFVNSYFDEGFRPIAGLCNVATRYPGTIRKKHPTTQQFVHAQRDNGGRPTLSGNSRTIADLLEHGRAPRCIYVIGNNGEGKSVMLRDIVYHQANAQRHCIGLPMSHVDRFKIEDPAAKPFFTHMGAHKNPIMAQIGSISKQPRKVWLLKECLRLIGYSGSFYLELKSKLSHDRDNQRRRDSLDLMHEADMAYLNSDPGTIKAYQLGFVREEHRGVLFENLSSGEQSILSLLIMILASNAGGTTFLIDEPEISLHISWQQRLPRVLKLLATELDASIVVATHSPVLIANTDEDDACHVIRQGDMTPIPPDQRHSVETLVMDGFGTYTPNNREVHERCAKIVASLITAANDGGLTRQLAQSASDTLDRFMDTIENNGQDSDNQRQIQDIDLIEKTLAAIDILLPEEQGEPRHG